MRRRVDRLPAARLAVLAARLPAARLAGLAVLAALGLALAAFACGPVIPTPRPSGGPLSSPSSPAATTPTGPSSPAAMPTTSTAPTRPAGTSTAAASPSALPAGVTVDPGLLEVLPAEVDGVTLEPDPATAAEIAADPLLAKSAVSIAVAVAIAPGASGADDIGIASVIRLRPDVFDDAFYLEWRETYNSGACAVADGVETEEPAEIGGRMAYVGTCVGGAHTYHTYLEDQGFIVSITATGEQRFGELILAGLAGVA